MREGATTMPMTHYVFLDPDGTQDFGVVVIIVAATGVTYAHQCGGLATEIREIEGFAVPVAGPNAAQSLRAFFHQRFMGNVPLSGERWTPALLDELGALVADLKLWKTFSADSPHSDHPASLLLDMVRLPELTEAWIPVETIYGPGVLLFPNSD